MSTGLQSQLGIAAETVYGTFVAPNRFLEFDSESMALGQNYVVSSGLRAGRRIPNIKRHRATTRSSAGDITFKVPTRNFGVILDMLHGNTTTPVQQAATAAYLQTHNIGNTAPDSKSRTVQIAKPQVGGTIKPHSYPGSKFVQAAFSMDVGGDLMCTLSTDAQDEDITQTLATASYASGTTSFLFTQGATVSIGSNTALVKSFNLNIPIPMATDRYGIGTSPLKLAPQNNDYIRPTMSIVAEYYDDVLYGYHKADTEIAVDVKFEGATIASTYKDTIEFAAAGVKVTGATPLVNGAGLLEITAPLEIYDTGSGTPLVISYMSTETAI